MLQPQKFLVPRTKSVLTSIVEMWILGEKKIPCRGGVELEKAAQTHFRGMLE
jgi:hypothetical protein